MRAGTLAASLVGVLLVVDNRDSFTFNLVQLCAQLGAEVVVRRPEAADPAHVRALGPTHVLLGPGPGRPDGSGASERIVRELAGSVPILGVCYGQQAIAVAFGGKLVEARELVHGRASAVAHDGRGIFEGSPNPLLAGRYHSLAVDEASFPACLEVSARAPDGEIMGLRHRELPVEAVQFHPESILSNGGAELMRRFLAMAPKSRTAAADPAAPSR